MADKRTNESFDDLGKNSLPEPSPLPMPDFDPASYMRQFNDDLMRRRRGYEDMVGREAAYKAQLDSADERGAFARGVDALLGNGTPVERYDIETGRFDVKGTAAAQAAMADYWTGDRQFVDRPSSGSVLSDNRSSLSGLSPGRQAAASPAGSAMADPATPAALEPAPMPLPQWPTKSQLAEMLDSGGGAPMPTAEQDAAWKARHEAAMKRHGGTGEPDPLLTPDSSGFGGDRDSRKRLESIDSNLQRISEHTDPARREVQGGLEDGAAISVLKDIRSQLRQILQRVR